MRKLAQSHCLAQRRACQQFKGEKHARAYRSLGQKVAGAGDPHTPDYICLTGPPTTSRVNITVNRLVPVKKKKRSGLPPVHRVCEFVGTV